MAIFHIQRGDSMPPLVISMRIAGTDPEEFYNTEKDDVGGTNEDNVVVPGGISQVKFIMKDLTSGVIVGLPANVAQGFTGFGVLYNEVIPGEFEDIAQTIPKKKTLLRYNWQPPETDWPTNPAAFPGDTGVVGIYRGEFEVIYDTADAGYQKRKRTFPVTPGDHLTIMVNQDLNDR